MWPWEDLHHLVTWDGAKAYLSTVMETLQVMISWLLSVKPYTSGSLFIVYKCMVGWPKAFPKQSPFKHVHEAKGECEHHGMVLLCGLVPGQVFSSWWLTLSFVKRWCICGFTSLLLHSFNPQRWFTQRHISLCLLHISLSLVIDRPLYAINPTKDVSFC